MKKVNDDTFEKLVLESDKPVLVDFYTSTCQPCKALAPRLDKLAKSRDDILFLKLDAGESVTVVDEYDICSVPTLILFSDGEVIDEMLGLVSEKELTEWIDNSLEGEM
jgi:thioredoxin 1